MYMIFMYMIFIFTLKFSAIFSECILSHKINILIKFTIFKHSKSKLINETQWTLFLLWLFADKETFFFKRTIIQSMITFLLLFSLLASKNGSTRCTIMKNIYKLKFHLCILICINSCVIWIQNRYLQQFFQCKL